MPCFCAARPKHDRPQDARGTDYCRTNEHVSSFVYSIGDGHVTNLSVLFDGVLSAQVVLICAICNCVTVWRCFSFNCKLHLHVLQGNLNGVAYRDNVLAIDAHVPPHFDNHRLADRPIFMDANARKHRARLVRAFLEQ